MKLDGESSTQAFCYLANLQDVNPKGVEYNNASRWPRGFAPPPEDINHAGGFFVAVGAIPDGTTHQRGG